MTAIDQSSGSVGSDTNKSKVNVVVPQEGVFLVVNGQVVLTEQIGPLRLEHVGLGAFAYNARNLDHHLLFAVGYDSDCGGCRAHSSKVRIDSGDLTLNIKCPKHKSGETNQSNEA